MLLHVVPDDFVLLRSARMPLETAARWDIVVVNAPPLVDAEPEARKSPRRKGTCSLHMERRLALPPSVSIAPVCGKEARHRRPLSSSRAQSVQASVDRANLSARWWLSSACGASGDEPVRRASACSQALRRFAHAREQGEEELRVWEIRFSSKHPPCHHGLDSLGSDEARARWHRTSQQAIKLNSSKEALTVSR